MRSLRLAVLTLTPSPSARRAWIEIHVHTKVSHQIFVALRTEGVDRNSRTSQQGCTVFTVALRTEGVDRNSNSLPPSRLLTPSPSARRAWIEMCCFLVSRNCIEVALRTEGVDRNFALLCVMCSLQMSPSARRAWIEILHASERVADHASSPSARRAWIEIFDAIQLFQDSVVALRTEGVDRNFHVDAVHVIGVGRPPHGGRG